MIRLSGAEHGEDDVAPSLTLGSHIGLHDASRQCERHEVIVCTVGKTILHYDAGCLDDLHAMLKQRGDFCVHPGFGLVPVGE